MKQVETQAVGLETYSEGFKRGFEAARSLFGIGDLITEIEGVKTLSAGSMVRDGRGRLMFRTAANGWVTVAGTRFSSMYLFLPVEVLFNAALGT